MHCVCPNKGSTPCATLRSSNQTCSTYSNTALSRRAFQHPVSLFCTDMVQGSWKWMEFGSIMLLLIQSTSHAPGLPVFWRPVFLKNNRHCENEAVLSLSTQGEGRREVLVQRHTGLTVPAGAWTWRFLGKGCLRSVGLECRQHEHKSVQNTMQSNQLLDFKLYVNPRSVLVWQF